MRPDDFSALRRYVARPNLVVLVGAGVSLTASGSPFATWNGLLRHGISEAAPAGPTWVKKSERLLDSGGAADLVELGQRIQSALGTNRFAGWLDRTVGSLRAEQPEIVDAILGLRAPIVTTNFDSILATHGKRERVTWREPEPIQRALAGETNAIVHLHGVWDEAPTVIFGVNSYSEISRQSDFQALQHAIVSSKSLLLVGVGDGADDPNLGALFEWFGQVLPHSRSHYQLCHDDEYQAMWDRCNALQPIRYGRSFDDLTRVLVDLAAERESIVVKKPSSDTDRDDEILVKRKRRRWWGLAGGGVGVAVLVALLLAGRHEAPTVVTPKIDASSPYAVRELRVAASNSTTALLTWKDPTLGAQQVVVFRRSEHDRRPIVVTPGPERGQTTFTVLDLNPDLAYCFFVVSVADGMTAPPGVGLRTSSCPSPQLA